MSSCRHLQSDVTVLVGLAADIVATLARLSVAHNLILLSMPSLSLLHTILQGACEISPALPGTGDIRITWLGLVISNEPFIACDPVDPEPCPYDPCPGEMRLEFEADLADAPAGKRYPRAL